MAIAMDGTKFADFLADMLIDAKVFSAPPEEDFRRRYLVNVFLVKLIDAGYVIEERRGTPSG